MYPIYASIVRAAFGVFARPQHVAACVVALLPSQRPALLTESHALATLAHLWILNRLNDDRICYEAHSWHLCFGGTAKPSRLKAENVTLTFFHFWQLASAECSQQSSRCRAYHPVGLMKEKASTLSAFQWFDQPVSKAVDQSHLMPLSILWAGTQISLEKSPIIQ